MTWAFKKTLWKGSMEMSRLAEIDPVTCGDSDKGLLVTSKLPLYWEFIGMSFLQRGPIWRSRTGHNSSVCAACGGALLPVLCGLGASWCTFAYADTGLHLCEHGEPLKNMLEIGFLDSPSHNLKFYLTAFHWKKQNKTRSYYSTKLLYLMSPTLC